MPAEVKRVNVEKILGAAAETIVRDFVSNQMAAEADDDFGVTPGTVTVDDCVVVSIWLNEDDGEGGTRTRVVAGFEKDGNWTAD